MLFRCKLEKEIISYDEIVITKENLNDIKSVKNITTTYKRGDFLLL